MDMIGKKVRNKEHGHITTVLYYNGSRYCLAVDGWIPCDKLLKWYEVID